jgi:hypothetical protein
MAVRTHLQGCAGCRRTHDDVKRLLGELPLLRHEDETQGGMEALEARLLRVVPAPARRACAHGSSPVRRLELRRVAGWALVFAGCWWQLAGGAVETFARDQVAPVARTVFEGVQDVAGEQPVLDGARRVNDSFSELSSTLHRVVFGEGPRPGPPASPDDS